MKRSIISYFCIIGILAAAPCAMGQGSFKFSIAERTSSPAPVPAELRSFSSPVVNDRGQVAFNSDGGVFLRTGGNVAIVAALGTPAPGGGKFIKAGPPAINSRGQILFEATATSPSRSGLFLFSNNQIVQVVKDQSATFGGNASPTLPPALNDVGDIAFSADAGIFLKSGGTISKIVSIGDPSPDGGTFTRLSRPFLNHGKQVAFTSYTTFGSVICLSSGGTLTKIVRSFDQLPSGGFFLYLDPTTAYMALNDTGQVAFSGPPTSGGPSGIFLYSNGTISLPIPDGTTLQDGTTIFDTQAVSLNSLGEIAFSGFDLEPVSPHAFLFSNGNFTRITKYGQAAPGGDQFVAAFAPSLSNHDQVAFVGDLLEHNGGIFLYSGGTGQIARVAGQGDPVQGQPGFNSVTPLAGFNRRGTVGILGTTFPGGTGLFLNRASHSHLIAHQGDPAPGGGVMVGIFGNSSMNASDQIAFFTESSETDEEIALGTARGVTKIVRRGDPSPDGSTFAGLDSASINNAGQIIFPASTNAFDSGIYMSESGQITRVIDQNDPAPGGGTIGFATQATVNDHGDIAFLRSVSQNVYDVFLFSQGTFTAIAHDQDPAPGGGTFLIFPETNTGPLISRNGDVVFMAELNEGGSAVYRFSHGVLSRVAGPGDNVPGGTLIAASGPSINAAGQIVYTGQTSLSDFSVYLRTGGTTTRVAGKGDAVGAMQLRSASNPRINDLGQVAFSGVLSTGDMGIVIATPKAK